MMYNVGDKIVTKKAHPCKSNEWTIVRVGADYKIKCLGCGRVVMLSKDELDKMTKNLITGNGEDGEGKR